MKYILFSLIIFIIFFSLVACETGSSSVHLLTGDWSITMTGDQVNKEGVFSLSYERTNGTVNVYYGTGIIDGEDFLIEGMDDSYTTTLFSFFQIGDGSYDFISGEGNLTGGNTVTGSLRCYGDYEYGESKSFGEEDDLFDYIAIKQ